MKSLILKIFYKITYGNIFIRKALYSILSFFVRGKNKQKIIVFLKDNFFKYILEYKLFSKNLIYGNYIFVGSSSFIEHLDAYYKIENITKISTPVLTEAKKIIDNLNYKKKYKVIIDNTNFFLSKKENNLLITKYFQKKLNITSIKIINHSNDKLKIKNTTKITNLIFNIKSYIDFTQNNPFNSIIIFFEKFFYKKKMIISFPELYEIKKNKLTINRIKFILRDNKKIKFFLFDLFWVIKDDLKDLKTLRNYENLVIPKDTDYKSGDYETFITNNVKKKLDYFFLSNIIFIFDTDNWKKEYNLLRLAQFIFRGGQIYVQNKSNKKNLIKILNPFFEKNFLNKFIIHVQIKNKLDFFDDSIKERFSALLKMISSYQNQLNEVLIEPTRFIRSKVEKKNIVLGFTLNRCNHLSNIKKNIKKLKVKSNKKFLLCHNINHSDLTKVKKSFKNYRNIKLITSNKTALGPLLNKLILNSKTMWIKLDDDDAYYDGYVEEIMANLRISNCYYAGKKASYYHFHKKKNLFFLLENCFLKNVLNFKHVPGATMSGLSEIKKYAFFPEHTYGNLDMVMCKILKSRKIDFFVGSALFLKVNRFGNQNHTWKINNFKKNYGKWSNKPILDYE